MSANVASPKLMRAAVLASILLCVPATGLAQPLFRAPVVGQSRALVSASAHHTVADAAVGGGTIAAIHFDSDVVLGGQLVRSLNAGRTVALTRIDGQGRVLWVRGFAQEAGAGQPHLRVIERVHALADGGAVFGGSYGDGGLGDTLGQGVLMRVDPNGRTLWSLHPSVTSDYSRFDSTPTARGTVIVLGNFFRGRFQLPGAEAWSSRQRFSSFLAEVDLASGSVQWARRIPGEGRQIELARDGTIFVAGQFQRALRVGRSNLRAVGDRDVFVARYSATGDPIDAVGHGTVAEDHPRGIMVFVDRGFSVLVSSQVGGAQRYALLGFDAECTPTFQQPLGPAAEMVRSSVASSVLLALPGSSRGVSLRGDPYEVVDHVELTRFSSTGVRLGQRPYRFGGVGLLVRSLRARAANGRVVLSGVLTAGTTSESFHVWLEPPPAPRAVATAQIGSVL